MTQALDRAARLIETIAQNRTSGASELLQTALEAISLMAAAAGDSPPPRLMTLLEALSTSQPSMAPLLVLADEALGVVATHRSSELGAQLRGLVDRWILARQAADRHIAGELASLLGGMAHITTYSRSGTLLRALEACRRGGLAAEISISEALPEREGAAAAAELRRMGYGVSVTSDANLVHTVNEADVFLFGADAVLDEGIVNKIGTKDLAHAACSRGVPVYVVCGREKFLPSHLRPRFQLLTSTFDVTPHRLVTKLITDPHCGKNDVQ